MKLKLQLTNTPKKPFEQIHMDIFHIQKEQFVTINDTFSKYAQSYLIPTNNSLEICKTLLKFLSHHDIPIQNTCYSETEFHNHGLKEFSKIHDIKLHFTTPLHSNSNSPVERLHSILIELFRNISQTHKKLNTEKLMLYKINNYNNRINQATKLTP